MTQKTLRIATRNSPLAMWQAEFVRDKLLAHHRDLDVEIIGMTTRGDQLLDRPLAKIGGKGLFVKELENALLSHQADIAVHSMKDVGVHFPDGLGIACIMARHNPLDAFVSVHYERLDDLPTGAVVGTSSLRRTCQLRHRYPHLVFNHLRGNVNTRLAKLDNGDYDAIILACAGLERLELSHRIKDTISPEVCLPAIAQGSLGIEVRLDDEAILARLEPLRDAHNTDCATAERAVNETLNGSCQTPIAAFATLDNDRLHLRALVGTPDGKTILYSEHSGERKDARAIGVTCAESLLTQGAGAILAQISDT